MIKINTPDGWMVEEAGWSLEVYRPYAQGRYEMVGTVQPEGEGWFRASVESRIPGITSSKAISLRSAQAAVDWIVRRAGSVA